MKNLLLIMLFCSVSIVACTQKDTTMVQIEFEKENSYLGKPKPVIKKKPKPKFGSRAPYVNHQDLTEKQKNEAIFIVENQPYIHIDSVLHKVDFKDRIYKKAEQMPMFPACDSLIDYELRKPCADKALLDFIYENLKYPYHPNVNCGEGTCVVYFVVEKSGEVSRTKIVRDLGCGLGEEAVRVVKLFPDFIPGMTDGKPVRVEFHLPIRFRLE